MDHFFRLYWILVTLLLLIYVPGFFGPGSTWGLISLTRDRTRPPPLGDKFSTTGLGRSRKPFFFFNFKNFTWGSREGREQARGHKEGETRLIPKMRGKVRGRWRDAERTELQMGSKKGRGNRQPAEQTDTKTEAIQSRVSAITLTCLWGRRHQFIF